ncbi:MAG: hypothetical protein APR56_06990 [Methanosaeta sp. SDB]|nr:MAG: hypothetical protein APR56_06990 [Methanosaeta sp. SDB]
MPFNQKLLAVAMAVCLLVFIIEAVRRRKLREEYAWLWVLIGIIILVLALWPHLLKLITSLLGIELPVNTVFFFGLMFIVFINLHFSVKISHLTNQVKRLAQEEALTAGDGRSRNQGGGGIISEGGSAGRSGGEDALAD